MFGINKGIAIKTMLNLASKAGFMLNPLASEWVAHYFLGSSEDKELPLTEGVMKDLLRYTHRTFVYRIRYTYYTYETLTVTLNKLSWWRDALSGVVGNYNIHTMELTSDGIICHCEDRFDFNDTPYKVPILTYKGNMLYIPEHVLHKLEGLIGRAFYTRWSYTIPKTMFEPEDWEFIEQNFHPRFLVDWGRVAWRESCR